MTALPTHSRERLALDAILFELRRLSPSERVAVFRKLAEALKVAGEGFHFESGVEDAMAFLGRNP